MSHSHSNSHKKNRRNFLKLSAKLAALGVASAGLGRSRVFAAESQTTTNLTDYKALVCLYLFGGNDGNNMIVPIDNRYATYQSLRSGIALSPNQIVSSISDGKGGLYGLHYGMPELSGLYDSGELAFVLNMGQLDVPLTKDEYVAGLKTPTNLFSHSDQIVQAQTGTPKPNGFGWGGRLLDCCGVHDTLAAISMSSPALFLQGFNVAGNAIPPGQGLNMSGMNFWPSNEALKRRQALDALLLQDNNNDIRKAANRQMADGLQLASALQNTGQGSNFSFPGTALGNQLKEVAKMIELRSTQGPGRQVFFVSMDGFDLHSGQDWNHWYLLSTLSQAVSSFNTAIKSLPNNMNNHVTLFTQSEFGRTLQASGTGSDHAWGSHQMVLGGAVKGGIYGAYPTLALGGPDDANNRGVWIPKISTGQFGATLGKWFGASDEDLLLTFDNLDKFGTFDLGFMKTS